MKKTIFLFVLIIISLNSYSQPNWTKQTTGVSVYLNSIFFVNQNTGYCVGDNSTFLYTTNGGTNWNYRNIGTGTESLLKVFFINDTVGFVLYFNKVMRTTNRGVNWTTQTLGCFVKDISFRNVPDGIDGYIAGYNPSLNGVVYYSPNEGTNWVIVGDFQNKELNTVDIPKDGTILVAGVGSFIARSTNYGLNWTQFNIGTVPLIEVDFPDTLTGYVCGGTIAKTTNGGLNWIGFTNPGSGMEMKSIHFPNPSTGYCTGLGSEVEKRIQKTTNGGLNWTPIGYLYDTIVIMSTYFVNPTTGWVCGSYGTIRKTINGGVTSINNISTGAPSTYSLHQNYPNPFNPSTIIRFQIKDSRFVRLYVYDILGKEVATLVNEKINAGEYEITYNSNNLPSGVYFYKLEAGDFKETKKMVLIK